MIKMGIPSGPAQPTANTPSGKKINVTTHFTTSRPGSSLFFKARTSSQPPAAA
jgi:hypothetical protein